MRYAMWLVLFGLVTSTARAENWADEMFAGKKHDFGNVAAGAKTEYRFTFTNLFVPDVHVSNVRTSCGCTTPIIVKNSVKTHEKGEIIAHFNTDRFTGKRGATITVTFDQPQRAEVQLRVDGYIRTDVSLNPSVVNFGNVDRGAAAEQQVTVDYHGGGDWRVTEVRSDSAYLDAQLIEPAKGSRNRAQVMVKLKDNAPLGYIRDQITLVTTDGRSSQLPVMVEGRVVSELTVNPTSLVLTSVPAGQKVTKQVVLQAKKPFKVTKISCSDSTCEATMPSDEAKTWHLIPITFTANETGKVQRTIRIETDLAGGMAVEVPVQAEVAALAGK